MKTFILILCFTCAFSLNLEEEWKEFKIKYKRSYSSQNEELYRKNVFIENLKMITEHNKLHDKSVVSYRMGITRFTDQTDDEAKMLLHGFKYKDNKNVANIIPFVPQNKARVPDEFDWRDHGAVTPVKDQGHCGSCWTFSTTGALEGAHFLKTGKLISLSEQNLLDCTTEKYGNNGCCGGFMGPALQYVIDNDGLDSEESYPYEATQKSCRYTLPGNVTSNKAIIQVEPGNEELLKIALATLGPISVAIDASNLRHHVTGIHYFEKCGSSKDEVNHAVLLVGYGVENGIDYWLIKNSWGLISEAKGYHKLIRNKNNNCGIATYAVVPLL